jgi:hypothetical protein
MVMFATILITSLLGVALCAAAFAAATRGEARPEVQPGRKPVLEPARFFVRPEARPAETSLVPVEVLVSQIERHVRLEQAAAEAYLDLPTRDALHSRTASPLLN